MIAFTRQWDISTKVIVVTCGLVFLLLVIGTALLLRFEIGLIDSYNDEHRHNLEKTLDRQADEAQKELRQNLQFNTGVLAGSVAVHLYNYDETEMQKALLSFMNYPEVLAIEVLDETGEVFTTLWKTADGYGTGAVLPKHLQLHPQWQVTADSRRNDRKLGLLRVHYTEAILEQRMARLKSRSLQENETFYQASRARLNRAMMSQVLGVIAILLVLILALWWLLRLLIHQPLMLLSAISCRLADLDLTVDIQARDNDEVGRLAQALHQVILSFRQVLHQARHAGGKVNTATEQLSSIASQQQVMMDNHSATAWAVGETIHKIGEVSGALSDNMQNLVQASTETAEFATHGQNGLIRMEEAIRHMERSSRHVSDRLSIIHEKADNITHVVTTITKVAEQTNLLSLNAAIEAEKAGNYGRGFTVVAREIRRLADQTAVATLDIARMVKEMQSAVGSGVAEIDKFINEVRHSAGEVAEVSGYLGRIIDQVQTQSPRFAQINDAVMQQSGHAREIEQAMGSLSDEIMLNSVALEEAFIAIAGLETANRSLHKELARFTVTENEE